MFGSSPPRVPATGSFLLPVCVPDAAGLRELLSAIDLYRLLVKGGEYTAMFDALIASTYAVDADNPSCDIKIEPPAPEEIIKIIVRTIYSDDPDLILDVIEDDMTRPVYQKFNDRWFVGFECDGCGGYEWVELGTGVALDPSGSPLPSSQTSVSLPVVSAGAATDCYAAAAIDYLLARFRQWLNAASGVATFALDEIFAGTDEVIDLAATLLQKSDGSSVVSILANYAEDEIYLSVAQHRAALISAWSLSGKISVADLLELFMPVVGKWTVAGQAIIAWLSNSYLLGISRDIAKLASDCEGGVGLLAGTLLPPMSSSINELDATYREVIFENVPVFDAYGPTTLNLGSWPAIIGYHMVLDVAAVEGSQRLRLNQNAQQIFDYDATGWPSDTITQYNLADVSNLNALTGNTSNGSQPSLTGAGVINIEYEAGQQFPGMQPMTLTELRIYYKV